MLITNIRKLLRLCNDEPYRFFKSDEPCGTNVSNLSIAILSIRLPFLVGFGFDLST